MRHILRPCAALALAGVVFWPCPGNASTEQSANEETFEIETKSGTWGFRWVPERDVAEEDGTSRRAPAEMWASYNEKFGMPRLPFASFSVEIHRDQLRKETELQLSDLQCSMAAMFCEFDIDFPGGSWDDLGAALANSVSRAYERQMPNIIHRVLPKAVTVKAAPAQRPAARYPAVKAKAVVLHRLKEFGIDLTLQGDEASPLDALVLREDLSRVKIEGPEFYRADKVDPSDVLALLEMAWWAAEKGPLYTQVKYHTNTRMLVIRGTRAELDMAARVFASLEKTPAAPADDATGSKALENIGDKLDKIIRLLEKSAREK